MLKDITMSEETEQESLDDILDGRNETDLGLYSVAATLIKYNDSGVISVVTYLRTVRACSPDEAKGFCTTHSLENNKGFSIHSILVSNDLRDLLD